MLLKKKKTLNETKQQNPRPPETTGLKEDESTFLFPPFKAIHFRK